MFSFWGEFLYFFSFFLDPKFYYFNICKVFLWKIMFYSQIWLNLSCGWLLVWRYHIKIGKEKHLGTRLLFGAKRRIKGHCEPKFTNTPLEDGWTFKSSCLSSQLWTDVDAQQAASFDYLDKFGYRPDMKVFF